MSGRRFNVSNRERPDGLVQIIAAVPACFDAFIWPLYVEESYRAAKDDPAARRRMERGQVPDFCSECTVGHRQRMRAAGRCQPPSSTPQAEEAPRAAACV